MQYNGAKIVHSSDYRLFCLISSDKVPNVGLYDTSFVIYTITQNCPCQAQIAQKQIKIAVIAVV